MPAQAPKTLNAKNTIRKSKIRLSKTGIMIACGATPPYGKEIAKFVRKAALSSSLVVMLLPARTDTKYFHEYIYNKQTIYFLKGRLKFSNSKTPAPFPSMIVVFRDYLRKD